MNSTPPMAFWMTSWVFRAVLPHKSFGHQAGAVHLHQLALGQHADGVIQLGQKAGHRSLACPRVAQKHRMQ